MIGPVGGHCVQLEDAQEASDRLGGWLAEKARTYGLTTLLAHADDGVIWGTIQDGALRTAPNARSGLPPALNPETLQTARLFGEGAEVFIWRVDGAWQGRLLQDVAPGGEGEFPDSIDEEQILWGTQGTSVSGEPFVLMTDGVQELRHVVPAPGAAGVHKRQYEGELVDWRPLRLQVRHYIQDDKRGIVRVSASRLIRLRVEALR